MKTDSRLKSEYFIIHHALHNMQVRRITTLAIPVSITAGGLRYAEYDKYRFIQQNPHKSSVHAKAARDGKRITWGMPLGVPEGNTAEPWIYLDDEIETRFTNQQADNAKQNAPKDGIGRSFGHVTGTEEVTGTER